ncbi:exodeoxyribonuclease VII large subunit, partial [Sedimenticola sp.]
QAINTHLSLQRQRLGSAGGKLDALSPLATLQRGYSITRLLPSRELLHNANQVQPGDQLETRLAVGTFISTVDNPVTDQ